MSVRERVMCATIFWNSAAKSSPSSHVLWPILTSHQKRGELTESFRAEGLQMIKSMEARDTELDSVASHDAAHLMLQGHDICEAPQRRIVDRCIMRC